MQPRKSIHEQLLEAEQQDREARHTGINQMEYRRKLNDLIAATTNSENRNKLEEILASLEG